MKKRIFCLLPTLVALPFILNACDSSSSDEDCTAGKGFCKDHVMYHCNNDSDSVLYGNSAVVLTFDTNYFSSRADIEAYIQAHYPKQYEESSYMLLGDNGADIYCYADESEQCIQNGSDGIAKCYVPSKAQKEGSVSWCEPYSGDPLDGNLYITSNTELVNGQYYTSEKRKERYCPPDRPCNDDTGCTWYTEDDGYECMGDSSVPSSCIVKDGQAYAMICAEPNYGDSAQVSSTDYLQYLKCDACTTGSQNYPAHKSDPFGMPYCLDRCDTEGATKYKRTGDVPTLATYDLSTEWKCKPYTDGNLYWQVEKTVECSRGVGTDGKCINAEGEGVSCDLSNYANRCATSDFLMGCVENPTGGSGTTATFNCAEMGNLYGQTWSCATVDQVAMCAPSTNTMPCTNPGDMKTVCYEFEYGTAANISYICKKLPDGSLGYVIHIPSPIATPRWITQCKSDKCNADHTNCL